MIYLFGIRVAGAIIYVVGNIVVVDIRVAGVTLTFVVGVFLIRVEDRGAIVGVVGNIVAVFVRFVSCSSNFTRFSRFKKF